MSELSQTEMTAVEGGIKMGWGWWAGGVVLAVLCAPLCPVAGIVAGAYFGAVATYLGD